MNINIQRVWMTAFLKRWGVVTQLSSAQYPQSNGWVEATLKTAKKDIAGQYGMKRKLGQQQNVPCIPSMLKTPCAVTVGQVAEG